jgi:thiamine phosphate synthase YjbQ (UPF0047 family)
MNVKEVEVEIKTNHELDIVDITSVVQKVVSNSGMKSGIVNFFSSRLDRCYYNRRV